MQRAFRDVRDGVLLVEYPGSSGDEANAAAVALGRGLRNAGDDGLLDAVPGARSLLVVFDPGRLTSDRLRRLIERVSGMAPDAGIIAIQVFQYVRGKTGLGTGRGGGEQQ